MFGLHISLHYKYLNNNPNIYYKIFNKNRSHKKLIELLSKLIQVYIFFVNNNLI